MKKLKIEFQQFVNRNGNLKLKISFFYFLNVMKKPKYYILNTQKYF